MFGCVTTMKDHQHRKSRRRFLLSWIFMLLFVSAFTSFHFFFKETLHPKLVTSSSLPTAQMEAISGDLSTSLTPPAVTVHETVIFPDQVLLFLKYPPSTPLFTRVDINCVYSAPSDGDEDDDRHHRLQLPPNSLDDDYFGRQIVRCPLSPRGSIHSLSTSFNGNLPAGPTYRWDSLAYEAVIDSDNTTIVFVKGLRLRQGKPSDPSKFKCVYGSDSSDRGPIKFFIHSDVVSIAQEIVRCQTPAAILSMMVNEDNKKWNDLFKVSVRMIGKRNPVKSVARLERRLGPAPGTKEHKLCICTMLRNQAQFIREWVVYHSRIGVGRWFIYDNNSSDDLESVIQSLVNDGYNISRQVWPWIKTQESGFAHCALQARESCQWVGFIDVDEFFYLASANSSLHDVLDRYSDKPNSWGGNVIGELRIGCLNFGPSGQKRIPPQGVTVGYTCRLRFPERHKSLIRPEALNETLMSMVHHFHLKSGYNYANLAAKTLVINHYKYQVWEVFKEKFHMRVATYVSDWQKDQNAHSKDRTPGLGTKAVEPRNWSSRFCQVKDTRLRDRVMETFADPKTGKLPWQSESA